MDKAKHIYEKLGPWAADYFILKSIIRFKRTVEVKKGLFFARENNERAYLLKKLNQILTKRLRTDFTANNCPLISPKLD
jgi:hypothetical protein